MIRRLFFFIFFAVSSPTSFFLSSQVDEKKELVIKKAIEKTVFVCKILHQRSLETNGSVNQKNQLITTLSEIEKLSAITNEQAYLAAGKKLLSSFFPEKSYDTIATASYANLIDSLSEKLPILSSLEVKKKRYVPDLWDPKTAQIRGVLSSIKNFWSAKGSSSMEAYLNKKKKHRSIQKKWVPFSFFLEKKPHLKRLYEEVYQKIRRISTKKGERKKIWKKFLQACDIETKKGGRGWELTKKFRINPYSKEIDIYLPVLKERSYEVLSDQPLSLQLKSSNHPIRKILTLKNSDRKTETDYLVTAFVKKKKYYYNLTDENQKERYYILKEGASVAKEITKKTFETQYKKGVKLAFYKNSGVYPMEEEEEEETQKKASIINRLDEAVFRIWIGVTAATILLLLFRFIHFSGSGSTLSGRKNQQNSYNDFLSYWGYSNNTSYSYQVERLLRSNGVTKKGGLKNIGNSCFCNSGLQFLKVFFYGRLEKEHTRQYIQDIQNDRRIGLLFTCLINKNDFGSWKASEANLPSNFPALELLKKVLLKEKGWKAKKPTTISTAIMKFYEDKKPTLKEQLQNQKNSLNKLIEEILNFEVDCKEKIDYLNNFVRIMKELQKGSEAKIKDSEFGELLKSINGEDALITGSQEDMDELWRRIIPWLFPRYYSLTLEEKRLMDQDGIYKFSNIQTFDAIPISLDKKSSSEADTVESLINAAYPIDKTATESVVTGYASVRSEGKERAFQALKDCLKPDEAKNLYALHSYFLLYALEQIRETFKNSTVLMKGLPSTRDEKKLLQIKLQQEIEKESLDTKKNAHQLEVLKTVLSPIYRLITAEKPLDAGWQHTVFAFCRYYLLEKKDKRSIAIEKIPTSLRFFFDDKSEENINTAKKRLVQIMSLKKSTKEEFEKKIELLFSSMNSSKLHYYYTPPENPRKNDDSTYFNYLASVQNSAKLNQEERRLTVRLLRDQYSDKRGNTKNQLHVYPNLVLSYGHHTYKFQAAVVHSGSSGNGGHYVAYTWNEREKIFQYISDSNVQKESQLTTDYQTALANFKTNKSFLWNASNSVLTGATFFLYKRMD